MRIMIAAGGTGGHVYPALAVAEALDKDLPGLRTFFVGSVGGFERPLVAESGLSFTTYNEVRTGPLHGVGIGRALISLINLAIGTLQALWLVARRRPQVLLLTGGWVGLPVAVAAWMLRVPALIYLPDIEPGLTIRVLRHLAKRVAVTVDESLTYFRPGQALVTGYPARIGLQSATREAAIAHFGLDPARKTLLIFGGSRGARSINKALLAILPQLLADALQVIHITGSLDWQEVEARRDELVGAAHYHSFPYLHSDMALALAVADLVVSRAGASVLGEFPLFGLAAILVPYPYAWRYQKVNARYLASREAAVYMEDSDMAEKLLPTIRELMSDSARLSQMGQNAAALAQPDGAERVAQELARLAGVST